jgi:hypothetical protein
MVEMAVAHVLTTWETREQMDQTLPFRAVESAPLLLSVAEVELTIHQAAMVAPAAAAGAVANHQAMERMDKEIPEAQVL